MHIHDKHGNTLHSLKAGEDVIIFKKGIIAPKAEHTFGNPNVVLGNILDATDTSALFMQWDASAPTHRIPVGNANTKARTLLYPLTDQERPHGIESIQACGKNHRYRDIMEAYAWVNHYLTVSPVYSSTQMQKKLSDGAYKSNLNFSTEEQLKESLCNALESVITLTTSLFQAAKSEALEANTKALNAVNNRYTVAMHNFTALEADTERHFLHERLLVATGDTYTPPKGKPVRIKSIYDYGLIALDDGNLVMDEELREDVEHDINLSTIVPQEILMPRLAKNMQTHATIEVTAQKYCNTQLKER